MENYQENSKTPFTLRDFEHWLYVMTSEGYGDDYENVPEEFWNFDPTSDPPGPYRESEVPPGPDYPLTTPWSGKSAGRALSSARNAAARNA